WFDRAAISSLTALRSGVTLDLCRRLVRDSYAVPVGEHATDPAGDEKQADGDGGQRQLARLDPHRFVVAVMPPNKVPDEHADDNQVQCHVREAEPQRAGAAWDANEVHQAE